jgi:hypothetical protein
LYQDPDDGDRFRLWNVCQFEQLDMVVSLRWFHYITVSYLKWNFTSATWWSILAFILKFEIMYLFFTEICLGNV